MRPRPPIPVRRPALAATAVFLLAGGCGGDGAIDDGTRAEVAALGDSAAMSLVRALAGHLNGALASGGPAEAITFCADRAQPLTDSISRSLGPGWEVKRTTLRTRNPLDAPDSLEALALRYFRERETGGSETAGSETAGGDGSQEGYVQRTAGGDFRYYMPLRVGHMCLQCHGDRSSLDPEVRRVLDERYPVDQATGYAQGDLRGVVRVTVPRAALRD